MFSWVCACVWMLGVEGRGHESGVRSEGLTRKLDLSCIESACGMRLGAEQ